MGAATPAELAVRLEREPAEVAESLKVLGRALTPGDSALAAKVEEYLLASARERSRALGRRGSWSQTDVLGLLTLQLVDPERFVEDAAFRSQILRLLPRSLDPAVPARLRDDLLTGLNEVRGFDFAASEDLELAWGAVPRRSAARQVPYEAPLHFETDVEGRIAASVYSLPSFFFAAAEAKAFLAAVRRADPERALVVLTDGPLRTALAPQAESLGLQLLDTYGRPYSPWPRDPFSLVRRPDGGVEVLVRPNLQPGRETDAALGRELVQNLPEAIDRVWGGPRGVTWTTAPTPFHNGQVLLTGEAAWLTLHALEPRILALLGTDRVPVDSFGTASGIDRYLAAARRAAAELAELYGRPVRFVHPLPLPGSGGAALMRRLGGGAGYDLDSMVTFLPYGKGRLAALVGDLSLGRSLMERADAEDLKSLQSGYGLQLPSTAALAAAQEGRTAGGLDDFLDLTAAHLKEQELEVRRLPLLLVPLTLLRDRAGATHDAFLLTWNNVVVEERGGRIRAEGFSSFFPHGDQEAGRAFAALGAHLDLFPPLARSVVLNGGYRCASNHVRRHGRVVP